MVTVASVPDLKQFPGHKAGLAGYLAKNLLEPEQVTMDLIKGLNQLLKEMLKFYSLYL